MSTANVAGVGTVWVNCFFVRDLRAPFGGTWSFDFYGDVKNTVYAPEGWRADG
jgi:aminomuconate-semialdehyde/2-hydroxymuconate-6-semialdehyde dehydrogenase